jgi:hypothetical protein
VVALATSDASRATVQSSVTVGAGSTQSATFPVVTYPVGATTTVDLIAAYNGVTKTRVITLNPLAPTSVTLGSTSVTGGGSVSNNRVVLNGPAPAGGAVVALSSSDPAVATVPPSVTVAAGATQSPAFTIMTTAVGAATPVTVTASHNGVDKTAILTVNPPPLSSTSGGP